jgi:hypothetical protein
VEVPITRFRAFFDQVIGCSTSVLVGDAPLNRRLSDQLLQRLSRSVRATSELPSRTTTESLGESPHPKRPSSREMAW